jgi:hypothetical protein
MRTLDRRSPPHDFPYSGDQKSAANSSVPWLRTISYSGKCDIGSRLRRKSLLRDHGRYGWRRPRSHRGSVLSHGTNLLPQRGLGGGQRTYPLGCPLFVPCSFELNVDLVFTEEFPDVNHTSITNFSALRKLGDTKMTDIIKSLR